MAYPKRIHLPQGLPGFEDLRSLDVTVHGTLPILRLEGSVGFWAAPVDVVDPEYEPEISVEARELLGGDPAQWMLAAILSSSDGAMTANLLAPLAINLESGVAVQMVRSDSKYSHVHPVKPAKGAACS